jgi:hypothetical protein
MPKFAQNIFYFKNYGNKNLLLMNNNCATKNIVQQLILHENKTLLLGGEIKFCVKKAAAQKAEIGLDPCVLQLRIKTWLL